VAVAWGILIEVGMVALMIVSPRESWLFAKVYVFLHYSHIPIFWLLEVAGLELEVLGVILLPLVGLGMALVWAGLLFWGSALVSLGMARLGLSGRQKRVLGRGVAGLCAAGLVYEAAGSFGDRPTAFTPTPAISTLVAGNTTLALDLYQKLRAKPGNVFFSPFGISTGLGLVYAGARGGTESELGRAAHFGLAQAELHPAFGELLHRLDRVQHGSRLTLVTANGLWCQQGYSFSNAFLKLARTSYSAETETVDFNQAADSASSRINAWVERRTRGRIPAALEAGKLDPDTRLVLGDVVYFKGTWRAQFDAKKTRPTPFWLTETQHVDVPTMSQEGKFKTARIEEPRATLIEMPYYGGDLAMVIILPGAFDGLAEIEEAFTPEKLNSWLGELDRATPHTTWVNLPRFTTRQSMDLIPVLRSLGVVSAFDDTADFSGMDGTKQLYLTSALQRAFVEVNEQGTEAAAVTHFGAVPSGGPPSFLADHPFLFLIRDRGSGTILFLGRLADPRA
jgi:serpin B